MSVRFKVFDSWRKPSKDTPLEEAAAFASELKPERLINISHSRYSAGLFGGYEISVVTVWYWDGD